MTVEKAIYTLFCKGFDYDHEIDTEMMLWKKIGAEDITLNPRLSKPFFRVGTKCTNDVDEAINWAGGAA